MRMLYLIHSPRDIRPSRTMLRLDPSERMGRLLNRAYGQANQTGGVRKVVREPHLSMLTTLNPARGIASAWLPVPEDTTNGGS